MDTNFATYVKRINYALENVIAPQLQTDFQRIQATSITNLLNQLQPRLAYRHDLLLEDVERLKNILQAVIQAFKEESVQCAEDLLSASEVDAGNLCGTSLKELHDRLEVTASRAINLLYENRNQLKNFNAVESGILEHITAGIMRDVNLYAPTKVTKVD